MAATAKSVASMDSENGLVLDENELEIAVKVMLQLSSNPELGHFSFLPPDSKGRKLRRALRIAALKWLKPGAADNMKDIQAQARDNDRVKIQQCGIRLARNQRKRALPAQHGHIMLDGEVPTGTPLLLPPLQDKPPEVAPRANKSEARVIVNSDSAATAAPPAALPAPASTTTAPAAAAVLPPTATTEAAAPNTAAAASVASPATPATTSPATTEAAVESSSVPQTTAAALDQSQLPTGRRPHEPAQGRVKTKRQDARLARDAERKAKREASNAVGVDVEDIREALKSSDSKRAAGVDIADEEDDEPTSTSTPKETKQPAPSSFSKTPEAMPAREPTESISSSSSREDFKEPPAGRPTKRKEKVYLRTPQPCYVCKKHYTLLHHFYDRMCPSCADFNYDKRFQTADLTLPPLPTSAGAPPQPVRRRIALVTGGRIKIGFECVLMLVRAGAFVIVTSRFPKDTAMRFAQEPDYNEWRDRIHIYGLDLRVLADVEAFCEHILATYPRLDMLINNAAQTIRRPPQYYEHMMTLESTPVAQLAAPLAATLHEFREPVQLRLTATAESKVHAIADGTESKTHEPSKDLLDAKEADIRLAPTSAIALRSAQGMSSAELSQVPLLPEDHVKDEVNFPVNCFDLDGQQIDKRSSQTWVKQLHEVSTVELAEVHIVNALAPFVLNSKLKPLLMRSKDGAFIINVSSMEGKFRAFKDVTHPHTNMAKAALNMMTHTVAKDLAHDRIFINSVDTGWVTEELPFPIAQQKKREGFEPPLDEIDGAARILDPIWRSIRDGVHDFGMFFKDYRPADW